MRVFLRSMKSISSLRAPLVPLGSKELNARLGASHFGIDKEIQEFLDAISPWHRFAETQTRPRTIGLWGMTGTGKSSLVHALVKELGMEDRTYWLDAGECRSDQWLHDVCQKVDENLNGKRFILVVDEFQHARTMEHGEAVEEPGQLRRFWELLDTGRATTWSMHYFRQAAHIDVRARITNALDAGAVVTNGKVVEGIEIYQSLVWKHYDVVKDERWAVPRCLWSEFRDVAIELGSLLDIEKHFSSMDGNGVLAWLEEQRSGSQRIRTIDASKALIIMLGNLDELYHSGKEPLAELDPDVLMHRHRNIGRTGVQNALLELFRIEQVARMGTKHVVFPPIGRNTIKRMVENEARAMAKRLGEHCGIDIQFDTTLIRHIAHSSPIAVMGARPVVEMVQNMLPLLLGQVLDLPSADTLRAVHLGMRNERPYATLDFGTGSMQLELRWPGQEVGPGHSTVRLKRIAVHETGHLLCGVRLCGMRPLQVCVRTRNPLIGGFVAWDRRADEPLLRSEVVPQLAMMLGGWAAEFLRYGTEGVSSGSQNDIQQATAFALELMKRGGLGNDRAHHADHATHRDGGMRHSLPEVEAEAKRWILQAEALAIATLRNEQDHFDQCVERLVAAGSLGMHELDILMGPGPVSEPQQEQLELINEPTA